MTVLVGIGHADNDNVFTVALLEDGRTQEPVDACARLLKAGMYHREVHTWTGDTR